MAWIEAHQSLRDHRKVMEVADRLDMPEPHVAGHMLYLWLWALDNAPDGVLPHSARIIERAAGWVGEPGVFVAALVAAELIDVDSLDQHTIHDWDEYAGKLMDRRKSNAERQREWRDRHKTTPDGDRNGDVRVTEPSRNGATEQNSTVQNSTGSGVLARGAEPAAASPEPAKTRPVPKARPTRVPETFAVTDRLAEFASAKGLSPPEIAAEAEKFRDHYQATGKTMVDWAAAWRNWVVRSLEFRTSDRPVNGTHPVRAPSQKDLARQSHERLRARIAAQELEEQSA